MEEQEVILNFTLPSPQPAPPPPPKHLPKQKSSSHSETKPDQKNPPFQEKKIRKKKDRIISHNLDNQIQAEVLESDEDDPVGRDVFSGDKFDQLGLHPRMERALAKLQLNEVTAIQRSSIPACLRFDNVLLKAETGSGKTLAYLVPALHRILQDFEKQGKRISRQLGPLLLVLAPTHELCLQIDTQLTQLLQRGNLAFLVSSCLMGGERVKREKDRLRKGVNILVATPGRLLYHFGNTSSLADLSNLKQLVLDESDRLLDMGFQKELVKCLDHVKSKCEPVRLRAQKLKPLRITLVSATLDLKIRGLLNELMDSFKPVGFNSTSIKRLKHGQLKQQEEKSSVIELSSKVPSNIQQYCLLISQEYRLFYLFLVLFVIRKQKVLVFAETCETADYLARLFSSLHYHDFRDFNEDKQQQLLVGSEIFKLHGKMAHAERVIHFRGFNNSKEGVLFATGVASRGLDFKDIDWVLHFDLEPELKSYINRVGRTARLNKKGKSLAFVLYSQKQYLSHMASQDINLKELSRQKLLNKLSKGIRLIWKDGRGSRRFKDQEIEKQFQVLSYMRAMVKDKMKQIPQLPAKAKLAVKSSLSALGMARSKNADIFQVKKLNLTQFERGMGIDRETAQALKPKSEKSGPISAAEVKKVMKKSERMERAIKNTKLAEVLAREFA